MEERGQNYNDIEYFKKLIKLFKDKVLKAEVVYENKVVASGLYLIDKNKVISLYLARDRQFKKYNFSSFMHYEMIKYCKKNKFDIFHFGGVYYKDEITTPNDYGLYRFKKGFLKNGFTKHIGDHLIELEK